MKAREIEILRYLLHHRWTHYADIAAATHLSERTVANYLDLLAADVTPYGVTVERKPSVGIRLTGSRSGKQKLGLLVQAKGGLTSQDEREHYLEVKLLLTDRPVTLQQLADDLFVSRSTVEGDFKAVKQRLQQQGVTIRSSHTGVAVTATEEQRRHLIAQLLRQYWGDNLYVKQTKDGQLMQNVQLPRQLQTFFLPALVDGVMAAFAEFTEQTHVTFNDYEFQSLAIHLVIAYKRAEGTPVPPARDPAELRPETRVLLALLAKHLHLQLPPSEQDYINLHLTNMLDQNQHPLTVSADADTAVLSEQLTAWLRDLQPDSELLQGLTLHLASALYRLQAGLSITNPYVAEIKRNLPVAFDTALALTKQLRTAYRVTFNDDEVCYLALHFASFFERQPRRRRIETVVVCSSGIGTSRLLAQRLEERFADSLHITRTIGLAELLKNGVHAQLVISTIPIEGVAAPVVTVNPLLSPADAQHVTAAIQQLTQTARTDSFLQLLPSDMVVVTNEATAYTDVIPAIATRLGEHGVTASPKVVTQAAVARENLASTALKDVAIPHVSPELIQRSAICLWIAPHGIAWAGGATVHLVFFMAVNQAAEQDLRHIYAVINQIIDDETFCRTLSQVPDAVAARQKLTDYIERSHE
ncbi:BglG family transcription antiterminator [Schleiferilactobacillus shenzhenensis]|uniref:Uncharacterized protein n=1 Tax=Schleiferilactobacillus shenzhenensis LY-73 TaxID=1231336 RepID=U4TJ46_9LACO|nr:PRD domain-containing protein [Schleiferilactobacillus shenzhenensis]ERL64816.1 hypothetical protein L248_0593 [Schleiferilactobacillus shenzhenensis LY-73]